MSKIDEAKEILNALQVPAKQQNAMCCCVLLAMAGLVEETSWQDATKNWLYFIESVTSVGPMEPKRIKEIEEMTTGVTAGKIYVTAFLDFKTFKKFSEMLAWETEVWIADMPDHMIHLNGDKFLGPRK